MMEANVIDNLLMLKAKLLEEYEQLQAELQTRLVDLETKIKAVATTIELCASNAGSVNPPIIAATVTVSNNISSQQLHGLRQIDALIAIALSNKGFIKPSEAKKLLSEAKVISGKPKNFTSHLYNLLKNSEQFIWVAPGTFRLGYTNGHSSDGGLEETDLIDLDNA